MNWLTSPRRLRILAPKNGRSTVCWWLIWLTYVQFMCIYKYLFIYRYIVIGIVCLCINQFFMIINTKTCVYIILLYIYIYIYIYIYYMYTFFWKVFSNIFSYFRFSWYFLFLKNRIAQKRLQQKTLELEGVTILKFRRCPGQAWKRQEFLPWRLTVDPTILPFRWIQPSKKMSRLLRWKIRLLGPKWCISKLEKYVHGWNWAIFSQRC